MLKVLIAEDSVLLADILEEFLICEGFDVCGIAATVHEAVMLADLHKPDLAVLDFRLGDGEYGSQIRPLLKDKISMGILYVSGDPLKSKLTRADGEAYVQKPYSMYDLSCALNLIQQSKTDGYISSSLFPKGFHRLEHSVGYDRQVG